VLSDPPKPKNPGKVAAGHKTAAKRWGQYPHRVVRLADLDSATREIVVSILRARKNAAEAQAAEAQAAEPPAGQR
jgi:hypothetical protein